MIAAATILSVLSVVLWVATGIAVVLAVLCVLAARELSAEAGGAGVAIAAAFFGLVTIVLLLVRLGLWLVLR